MNFSVFESRQMAERKSFGAWKFDDKFQLPFRIQVINHILMAAMFVLYWDRLIRSRFLQISIGGGCHFNTHLQRRKSHLYF